MAAFCAALILVVSAVSCGWSDQQQEIADDYSEAASTLSDGAWARGWMMLAPGTRAYLDSAAAELTRLDVPGCMSGQEFLALTFAEYFDLSGEITMILDDGDSIRLQVAGPAGTMTRWMTAEEDRWVLDLEGPYRDSVSGAFQGAYLEPSVIVPEPPDTEDKDRD